ncbi:MAG: sodium:solute symporter family protein [Gemmatimonadaceae bacterium]|nr:sodium:solute symporter family protein [Gemmatimonadaceae bacterium]
MLIALLLGYAAAQIALGLWLARAVRGASGFFVADRALGPGLLFATLLAANVGAGSTVGATGLGYTHGLAAWWWVGAAAIGSAVQAMWVGPRMRADSARHDLRTMGDWLAWRYDAATRGAVAVMLWAGSLAILAGQLIAMAWVLEAITGMPKWSGALLGGAVVMAYFASGGLRGAVGVNVVQVTVKVIGFGVALPLVLAAAGGWQVTLDGAASRGLADLWRHEQIGWPLVFVLGPAFIVSPGLIQKVFGARDDAAVRVGVGANALALLCFAPMPALFGMAARALHPDLSNAELALPTLMVQDLPPAVGALALAALFSAELSAADAVLFMLSTSLARDLWQRTLHPTATDDQVLRVVRLAAVGAAAIGVAIAVAAPSVVGSLSLFYSLMSAGLFVPVVLGLAWPSVGGRAGVAAVLAGAAGMLVARYGVAPSVWPSWCPPSLVGIGCSGLTFLAYGLIGPKRERPARD